MSSKLLASFTNKENALALTTELKNKVKWIWVMVMQPRPSHNFYDIEVQHASDSPCPQDQFAECEVVRDGFVNVVEEIVLTTNVENVVSTTEPSVTEEIRL